MSWWNYRYTLSLKTYNSVSHQTDIRRHNHQQFNWSPMFWSLASNGKFIMNWRLGSLDLCNCTIWNSLRSQRTFLKIQLKVVAAELLEWTYRQQLNIPRIMIFISEKPHLWLFPYRQVVQWKINLDSSADSRSPLSQWVQGYNKPR